MATARRNVNNEKLIEEIGDVLRNAQKDVEAFKTAIINKHVIIFLGNTRSGKSTLVNYVIGTKLISFEERQSIFKIQKADEQAEGPVIGQGSQSCTSIPGIYPLNEFGMIVIDAPGFDDNRSEAQDIVNALYISQIKHAKTVKFVLTADINELISDNIKGFTDLIEKIHSLFSHFEKLKHSVSIVFTKDNRHYTQPDIASLLRKKIVDVDDLHINKQLIQHFVEHNELIALFKMPSASGIVTKEIDVDIEHARVASCGAVLYENNIKVALSSKARLALLKIYQSYLDSAYFDEELKSMLLKFSEYFVIDDYIFASTEDELIDVRANLKHLFRACKTEKSSNIVSFTQLNESLLKILPMSQQFAKTFTVLIMIDDNSLMEDAIRDQFMKKYKDSLKGIVEKIEKLVSKIDAETEDRKMDRKLFTASAAATGVGGGAAVAGEVLHRVFAGGSRIGSPFGLLGILGAVVTTLSAGAATASFVVKNEKQKKRTDARTRQGRTVYDNMFNED